MFVSISVRHCVRAIPLTVLAGFMLTAAAQTVRPDPSDARATVPPVAYTSTFSGYARVGDGKPVTWREANDTVARIGGWRVYSREAQAPEVATPAPTEANKHIGHRP